MKRLCLFSLIAVFVLATTSLSAAQILPLGNGDLAIKMDYINFPKNDIKDLDLDQGLYVGVEAYGKMAPHLSIGLESGYVFDTGDATLFNVRTDTTLIYVPIELNLKLVFEGQNVLLDFGGGGSYNYARVKAEKYDFTFFDEEDWLWGGQVFADINYKMGPYLPFFIGLNAKYQWTEEFKNGGPRLDNWRVGAQIGMPF
jgi:hypothetical protein